MTLRPHLKHTELCNISRGISGNSFWLQQPHFKVDSAETTVINKKSLKELFKIETVQDCLKIKIQQIAILAIIYTVVKIFSCKL